MREAPMPQEGPLDEGWVAQTLTEEFPQLAVMGCEVAAPPGRTDPGVAERLGYLASRFNGRQAVELRREAIPAAYRVFYRHLGLDPDVTRTPIEEAALVRLMEGGYRAQNRLADALLLALLETGVPVSAFDAAAVDGPVGLREALAGERLGSGEPARMLSPGVLVLADAERPLAELFGDLADDALPRRATERLRLVSVRIPQVPEIHVEEALWICREALAPSA
jgi:DNA/RNA-binding domain of Phe-tRNA-synthetase-like protein